MVQYVSIISTPIYATQFVSPTFISCVSIIYHFDPIAYTRQSDPLNFNISITYAHWDLMQFSYTALTLFWASSFPPINSLLIYPSLLWSSFYTIVSIFFSDDISSIYSLLPLSLLSVVSSSFRSYSLSVITTPSSSSSLIITSSMTSLPSLIYLFACHTYTSDTT